MYQSFFCLLLLHVDGISDPMNVLLQTLFYVFLILTLESV